MWDVIEAHVMGRVRGKFHQVVCKLCYEDDSVLSMNVVGRRLTGKDTEALHFDVSRASRANAGACQRWSCPQVRRPLSLIGACNLFMLASAQLSRRGKSHLGDTERGDAIRPQAQFLDMGAARQRLCLHRYVMPVTE